jgi:hypothetical protein
MLFHNSEKPVKYEVNNKKFQILKIDFIFASMVFEEPTC